MENNKPERKYVVVYMLINVILSFIFMLIMYHNFGGDTAIISGLLILISLASAIRYEM